FVLAGMIVTSGIIFLIGDERKLFEKKQEYQSVFRDVQGLKGGSPVRMGGVDVGTVSRVSYADDPKDSKLYVTFTVVKDEARRIRTDSVATIDNKGLLGDKMIVITIGGPNAPPVPDGGRVKSDETKDIGEMMTQLSTLSAKAESIMTNLETTTATLADAQFQQDLRSSVKSLAGILKALDEGDGYAARLLKDPAEADRVSRTLANVERTTAELNRTSNEVTQIMSRINKGPGFAHDVIYGEGPGQALAQFGGAADELSKTLRGVREGNGMAKSFIYGDTQSQQVMTNLNAMSYDVRQILSDMRAGKGTLGALLVDPSVYEDLKMLLGNVDRNKTLRALVRYSIQRDEKASGVEVRDPTPASGVAPSGTRSGTASGIIEVPPSGPPGRPLGPNPENRD
ncbi:MAG TPA: MlaD family protein, partial [Polyangiaceae bacterium]|nr:MlaD family protein [Polyangiaceae bacterium]